MTEEEKKKRNKVTSDALIKIREGLIKLNELPEKPKDKKNTATLLALLKEFMPVIDAAKEKGYSLIEIVDMINNDHLKDTSYVLTLSNFRSNLTKLNMELKKPSDKKRPKKVKPETKPKTVETSTKDKSENKDTILAETEVLEQTDNKDDKAVGAIAPVQSIAQQVAKDTPPGTGGAKATDLKSGKDELFGKKAKK